MTVIYRFNVHAYRGTVAICHVSCINPAVICADYRTFSRWKKCFKCVLILFIGLHNIYNKIYCRFHGDDIRRVTWASGTTGWQKIFGWRAGSWIHALFTLILLTHKIMIMFCICVGTSGIVWTARFSLLSSKKRENEDNSGCKQWGGRSFNNNIY